MSKANHKPTDDAVEILHRRFVNDDPDTIAELEKIRADNDVERKIYHIIKKTDLRATR